MLSCQGDCLLQQLAAVQGLIIITLVQRPVSSPPCAWQAESASEGRAQPGERARAWQRGCPARPAGLRRADVHVPGRARAHAGQGPGGRAGQAA